MDPSSTKSPSVDGAWLAQLRTALDTLAAVPTHRIACTQDAVARRLHEHFGDQVDVTVEHWVTAHNDLHWASLTAPTLTVLGWEGWGTAPAGHDAATLYVHSLLISETARQVHEQFAYLLDTPGGRRAQLFAAARILDRGRRGDYQDLEAHVLVHARRLD